jgi:histidyl-tRNA synthetase
VMTELGIVPDDDATLGAYVTIFGPETVAESLALLQTLRAAGIAAISALPGERPDKLGKQLKEADQKGAHYALVLGPDELARGEVVIKDLRSGEQRSVPRAQVIHEFF